MLRLPSSISRRRQSRYHDGRVKLAKVGRRSCGGHRRRRLVELVVRLQIKKKFKDVSTNREVLEFVFFSKGASSKLKLETHATHSHLLVGVHHVRTLHRSCSAAHPRAACRLGIAHVRFSMVEEKSQHNL